MVRGKGVGASKHALWGKTAARSGRSAFHVAVVSDFFVSIFCEDEEGEKPCSSESELRMESLALASLARGLEVIVVPGLGQLPTIPLRAASDRHAPARICYDRSSI